MPMQCYRQVRAGKWAGGVNLTALRLSEDRAYGWYWFFKDNNTQSSEHLVRWTRVCQAVCYQDAVFLGLRQLYCLRFGSTRR